jgi:hypothetical protein
MEKKVALKDKKLRKQINGEFSNIGSADEKKNITIEPSFKNYKKTRM